MPLPIPKPRFLSRFLTRGQSIEAPAPVPPRERQPGPLRVVAITRILDESDIVEPFVRHTAAYASHHIFFDNGSRDGTIEILKALKDEGFGITVLRNAAVSFNEAQFNTMMFRLAADEFSADWVLCLDADEFLDDRAVEEGLNGILERLTEDPSGSSAVLVPLLDYHWTVHDDPNEVVPPLRIQHRTDHIPTRKVFVQGNLADVVIENGSHGASVRDVPVPTIAIPGLRLAHFPQRSPYQLVTKFMRGWAKVLAAGEGEVRRGTSEHYRGSYERFLDRPEQHLRDPVNLTPLTGERLIHDPVAYRGSPIRYTQKMDEPIRCIRNMVGYLDALAQQHGRLIDTVPQARAQTKAWNRAVERVL
ncbi:glycosyltransferase family 2 protein [Methylorubrum extorquens]|jgi:glycosyltransferase involved in cell wall biosynthesis|uniref:glycosyltransferase family 2 protein n=1 Tax=Methylorubrum extorquens TaxID=408 RepID=UPI0009D706D5|nr:glycosyltransferase family 2 protein [Methylorubrum extorquens]